MITRTRRPAILLLLLAAACGGQKHAETPATATAAVPGHDIAPITVRLSLFWETLDGACPVLVGASAKPDDVADADWKGVIAYCTTTPHDAASLALAASKDRESSLAAIIASVSGTKTVVDIKPMCDEARAKLSPNASKGPVKDAVAKLNALCGGPTKLSIAKLASATKPLFDGIAAATALHDPDVAVLIKFADDVGKLAATGKGIVPADTFTAAAAPSLGGIDLGSIVNVALNGLAQFLVKRAELELRTYAIDKMRKIGQCDVDLDQSVVHRLLANTCDFLGGDTGTLLAGFGPMLRAAFTQDLTHLPHNLVREVPAKGGEDELLVRVALESAAILVDDPDPIQIVHRVEVLASKDGDGSFTCSDDDATKKPRCTDAKASLYLAATAAQLVLEDGATIRISGWQLLELVRQRIPDVLAHIPQDSELYKNLQTVQEVIGDPVQWKALFGHLHDDADAIIANLKEARAALARVSKSSTFEDRARAVVDTTRYALRAIDTGVAVAVCIKDVAKDRKPTACPADREYLPGQVADFLDALARKDVAMVMTSGLIMARGALGPKQYRLTLPPDVVRLLSFGAELANAKTSDEAEAAIESVAAPPGGYKEKRKRDMVSIGGLVGIGGGKEWVSGAGSGLTTGVVGAVGLDFNHHFDGSSWTVGAFVTVIDLGGILNFGSNEDSTSTTGATKTTMKVDDSPQVTLAQVFAPGVGVRFGVADLPVELMLGVQAVPRARTVVSDGGTPTDPSDDVTRDRAVVRVMASLAVDVTIWSF